MLPKRVGVCNLDVLRLEQLKPDALYFDEITFDLNYYKEAKSIGYGLLVPFIGEGKTRDLYAQHEATVEYLIDHDVLNLYDSRTIFKENMTLKDRVLNFPIPPTSSFFSMSDEIQGSFVDLIVEEFEYIQSESEQPEQRVEINGIEEFEAVVRSFQAKATRRLKVQSMLMSIMDEDNVYLPVLVDESLSSIEPLMKEQEVAKVLVNRFPVPQESVAWEAIVEFRTNDENRHRLLALRRWAAKAVQTCLSKREIEEELEYLLQEYERLLKLHKMKYNLSKLELAVVTPLEVLENILKLRWSTAASAVFDVQRKKVDFMLAEKDLPGRELAYITEVRDTFSPTNASTGE